MKIFKYTFISKPSCRFYILIAILFVSLISCSSGTDEAAERNDTMKQGMSAEQLFESRCSICHFSNKAKAARKTKEDWESTVMRMRNKKPSIMTEDEARMIIDYLAETYGK